MTKQELLNKYMSVPDSLKQLKRWVCYRIETREGKQTKVPVNALNGNYAKSNDSLTWSKFNIAINGCEKYNCAGLGFMLGDGIFGIDLDNHVDPKTNEPEMTQDEFDNLAYEFISGLNSYAEKSQSGLGIHIICEGKLPEGRRRKGNVEMYDWGRFFAFTGNVLNSNAIINCEQSVIPLWEKYVKDEEVVKPNVVENNSFRVSVSLTDTEILNKAFASKNGFAFQNLYNGDLTDYGGDHSAADMAFCSMLAFWCNGNMAQMDRIFRSSSLMREKWDKKRGADTYGNITLNNAIKKTINGYVPTVQIEENNIPQFTVKKTTPIVENSHPLIEPDMNIDKDGQPILKIKKVYKRCPFNDTGNAERFYAYFGDIFRYNKEDKMFMFWTGKTWIHDEKDIIRKYANKFIDILKTERDELISEIEAERKHGDIDRADDLVRLVKAAEKNIDRISNKSGKDAMLSEFESLHNIPVLNSEFDKDKYLLNTDSGVINLETGEVLNYNPNLMLSKNTRTKVSYKEPKVWKKFLNDIFERPNKQETQEIIDCLQMALGYSLTGSTAEQVMFIMWGDGSNGKSTYSETVASVMGDYGTSVASDALMQNKQNSGINIYSVLARLKGKRYIETGETDEGAKFAENLIKKLTGSDIITARQLYGKEFEYRPEYKIWMATNKKPIIRGTDFGIWRRIFMFPFVKIFTEENKDKKMPEKLARESAEILGWMIEGYKKYAEKGGLEMPKCLKDEIAIYKQEMDIVALFLHKNCTPMERHLTPVKKFYTSYKNWAINETEFVMKSSKVEEEMRKKGYRVIKDKGELCYVGIRLNTDSTGLVFNNYDESEI